MLAAYAKLPLAFVPNAGQLDRHVRYAAQAGGSSFFFTHAEAVLALRKGKRGVALRLGFLGANPAPAIAGARPGTGRVNYLLGSDPARWHTKLPTYGEIVYRDLWPGADLRLRGQSGMLKYEFRLAPGADVSRIRLGYRGQQRLSLGQGGELRIETALGLLRDARPVSYQQIGGRRVAVESRFALGRGGAYGFTVGAYDPRYPLVIDPGLLYSTYLGGGDTDLSHAIAVDGAGSAYLTGVTGSPDFPTTAGAFDTTFNGGFDDAFVTKLEAGGAALGYSTYLGGSGDEYGGNGIALDGAGIAYLTGYTTSADFPTTAGAFDTTYNGAADAFVTKLDASGAALGYS
ncbi:MAG TPA: SBBP repeat-containing protein, partial [Thermoanaerobaculia bacterium]